MVYAAVRLEELWDEVGNWVVMDSWRWWFKRDGWPLAKKHGGGGPPQRVAPHVSSLRKSDGDGGFLSRRAMLRWEVGKGASLPHSCSLVFVSSSP